MDRCDTPKASQPRRISRECGRGRAHPETRTHRPIDGPIDNALPTAAHRVAKRLRAGTVYVNCYDADDITVPFGGFKQSGNGRDKSLHAMDKYTELKTTWIDLS